MGKKIINYYELRNKSVLVLCPKKLADNWLTYNRNLKTNILSADRLNYDVLNHTDLQRTSGYSHGTPLAQINWGNYDLVVIDESHNFRNNHPGEEFKKSRYQHLMDEVVRSGVKTKVLMLSATPVNNRFADLKNQLALAYEGESDNINHKLRTSSDIDEIFRRAQAAFNAWSKLPAEERTPAAILDSLDFDFFELLDSVTIARSRKHIEANYLYDCLADDHLQTNGLHTARVTGTTSPQSTLDAGYDFQSILTLFSPRSKEKDLVLPDDPHEIDLIIATDCISEGQNLQDCDFLINYDIHWNPVRIIQRFGRIDRIGSQNSAIQLVNYWPDISLDEYINLKERVENRMVIVDASASTGENPLTSESSDLSYRKEQLQKLQGEVIEMDDLKTGISITDLGLNDFRMDLVGYMKDHSDIANMPSGTHAIVPADPENGLRPGVIFTLRNRNQGINLNEQNRIHPFYLVHIDLEGNVVSNHTEVKRILDLTWASCKNIDTPQLDLCQQFNAATQDGRKMETYSLLLDQAISSIIEVKEEGDIDSLFTPGGTSALVDTIAGLDDFELISFLVIQ